MFLTKNRKFLEFSKRLSWTSKIQHFDYENISAVKCTGKGGTNNKNIQGSNQSELQILEGFGVFVTLRNSLQ